MVLSGFLLNDKNIERNGYIWNMLGSLLNAFQSVVILMVLNRVLGETISGIFTLAYANANLFLHIGKYGMRYYQVSDSKTKFTFSDYLTSRILSSVAMVVVAAGFTIFSALRNGYSDYKTFVVLWMCIFKVLDVVEDVYHGQYQKMNRLDVAGRCMTIRMFLLILCFGVGIVVFKDLLLSLIVTVLLNALVLIWLTVVTYKGLHIDKGERSWGRIKTLFIQCGPLFAGYFLSFYIGNAPKYSIDSMLSDDLQAIYGFVSMPVFVVGMLNNFIFNPQIYALTKHWENGEVSIFVKKTIRQIFIVFGITAVCMAGAYLLGVPVLSILYATDLAPYKAELLILLAGGGFLGLTGLLNAVITITRFQKSLAWGYLAVAIMALVFSDRIVGKYEMMGASWLYLGLMALLSLVFAILFIIAVKRRKVAA